MDSKDVYTPMYVGGTEPVTKDLESKMGRAPTIRDLIS